MVGVVPPGSELFGRDRELAELYRLIDGIEEGGGALVVRGEAGIGKSALLAAARERAHDRGVTVLSTAGTVSESRLAFAGLHQLLLPMLDRLELLPEPQRRALATAFGVADGDAPDLFLVGLATSGSDFRTGGGRRRFSSWSRMRTTWTDRPRRCSSSLRVGSSRIPSSCSLLSGDGVPSSFDDADLPELRLAGLDTDDASNALLNRAAAGLTGSAQTPDP